MTLRNAMLSIVLAFVGAAQAAEARVSNQLDLGCNAIVAASAAGAENLRSLMVNRFSLHGRPIHVESLEEMRPLFSDISLIDETTEQWPSDIPDDQTSWFLASAAVVLVAKQHHLLIFRDWQPVWSLWLERPHYGCDFKWHRHETISIKSEPTEICHLVSTGRLRPIAVGPSADQKDIIETPIFNAAGASVIGTVQADFMNDGHATELSLLEAVEGHYGLKYNYLALLNSDAHPADHSTRSAVLDALQGKAPFKTPDAQFRFLMFGDRTYLEIHDGGGPAGKPFHIVRTVQDHQIRTVCEFSVTTTVTGRAATRGTLKK
jgi:hypothetical protein